MPKFFICYRREDSEYPAQTIYERLSSEYDADSAVFDVDSVPLGADFREYLDNQVSRCDVLLAVIGRRWLDILNRRLDDDDDFVRIEIESALDRNIPIVPVLLAGASMPAKGSLPSSLAKLAYKNAAQVHAGKDLTTHLDRLIAGLERLLEERDEARKVRLMKEAMSDPRWPRRRSISRLAEIAGIGEADATKLLEQDEDVSLTKDRRGRPMAGLLVREIASDAPAPEDAWTEPDSQVEALAEPANNDVPRPQLDTTAARSLASAVAPTPEEDEKLNPRIRIEGGTFQMGSSDDDPDASYDEEPQHPVKVSSFWIQEHPVTNEEYQRFKPSHSFEAGGEPHPVVDVNWQDAMDYAQWLGGSLPTEAQWEFAARGTEGRKYPWGSDEPTPEHANYNNHVGGTTPVGTYPKGATPEGVHDLAGNVDEWCSDWYAPYSDGEQVDPVGPAVEDPSRHWRQPSGGASAARVLRGGAFDDDPLDVRCAYRFWYDPYNRYDRIGFRAVAPVQS